MLHSLKLIVLCFLMSQTAALAQVSDWSQWGGPHRNFTSETKGLAPSWPATGPRRLWQRELGEGYSAIAAEHGVLFTMYRKAENEIVIALDAATGKTIWEYSYAAPFSPDYDMTNGPGPHATPLVSGDRTAAPGLYFCGFRVTSGGALREAGLESARIAGLIAAN